MFSSILQEGTEARKLSPRTEIQIADEQIFLFQFGHRCPEQELCSAFTPPVTPALASWPVLPMAASFVTEERTGKVFPSLVLALAHESVFPVSIAYNVEFGSIVKADLVAAFGRGSVVGALLVR